MSRPRPKFKVGDRVRTVDIPVFQDWIRDTNPREEFVVTEVNSRGVTYSNPSVLGPFYYGGDRNNRGVWENNLILVEAAPPGQTFSVNDYKDKSVYVAGPMSGLPGLNFDAFFEAEDKLTAEGYRVWNPAQHDVEAGAVVFDEGTEQYTPADGFDLSVALLWDLDKVARADFIYVLPGWENSKGVAAELALAAALGKEVRYEVTAHGEHDDPQPLTYTTLAAPFVLTGGSYTSTADTFLLPKEAAGANELRVTSETGGQKGKKLAEMSALDPNSIMAIAEVAGFGAQKYDKLNFMKGYDWSLSYDAMMRHMHAFWGGEELDPESGLPHLAHAGWHALTLLSFMERGLGTDDRYSSSPIFHLQTKTPHRG